MAQHGLFPAGPDMVGLRLDCPVPAGPKVTMETPCLGALRAAGERVQGFWGRAGQNTLPTP